MIRKRRTVFQQDAGPKTKVVFVFFLLFQALFVEDQFDVDGQLACVQLQLGVVIVQLIEAILDFDRPVGQRRQQAVRVHVLFLVKVKRNRKDRHEHEEERYFGDAQTTESFDNKGENQVGRKGCDSKNSDVYVDVVAEIGGA